MDEAIKRARAFARAGCDMVWAEFPTADAEYPRRFAEGVREEFPALPLYFNYSSNLKWHESGVTFEELARMGYKAMHVSLAAMRVTMKAFWDYAVDLGSRGAAAEIEFQQRLAGHAMSGFHEFAGFSKIRALEGRYLPADEFTTRYEKSQGK